MPRPSALGLLALSSLALFAQAQIIQSGPNVNYLSSMCYPLLTNGTGPSSLSQSPFPCEQMVYLEVVCHANGTTPLDFAAEQQCLCGGNYFAASAGCAECYSAHGAPAENRDSWVSQIRSLSTAECAPATPTEPFINLRPIATYPPPSQATTHDASYATSADRLRSKTAVGAYYTGGAVPTPGAITGDATARLTSFTNTGNVIFTPTGAKSAALTTSMAGAGDAAASTTETGAAARRTAAGGLAPMAVGAVMML